MSTINAVVPAEVREREPKGFALKYGLASFGLFVAVLAPTFLALSLKIQTLVFEEDGPQVSRADSLAHAASQMGYVAAIGSLFALVSQPLAGRLSDRTMSRLGMRRPWILVGVIGAFVFLTITGFAPNIVILAAAFCAAQLFSNFAQAAETATVADQVPVSRRGFVSGIAGACTPVAILVIALGLPHLPGDGLKFALPALVGLVFGLWFAVTLKDRVRTVKPAGPFDFREFISAFVFNPRTHRNLGWAWLTKAMIMVGYIGVVGFLTLFLATNFDMDQVQQAAFNGEAQAISVVLMIIFSFVGGRLSDRLARRRIFILLAGLIVGVGVLVVATAAFLGKSGGEPLILIGMGVVGTGMGLFFAVDQALCIDVLPSPDDAAKDLGVLNIANTLPGLIVPLLGGSLILPLARATPGSGYPILFLLVAAVAVAGGLLVFRIKGVR